MEISEVLKGQQIYSRILSSKYMVVTSYLRLRQKALGALAL